MTLVNIAKVKKIIDCAVDQQHKLVSDRVYWSKYRLILKDRKKRDILTNIFYRLTCIMIFLEGYIDK